MKLKRRQKKIRRTEYERNFNCTKFYYEVPFTKEGGIQTDDITEQWKRKTLLETSQAFPHIFNRLTVNSKEIIELTPIQNAIESISSKLKKLQNELSLTLDSKSLQLLLHGILLAQVNVGPIAVAKTFLTEEDRFDKKEIEILKTTFIEFVKVIAKAVHKNKGLIENNQLTVQNQLEIGYFVMKDEVIKLTNIDPQEIKEDFVLPVDLLSNPDEEETSQNHSQSQHEKNKKKKLSLT